MKACAGMALWLGLAGMAAAESPEARIYVERAANGRLVFSDRAGDGARVVEVRPQVVPGSQLGLKAYPQQTRRPQEQVLSEQAAGQHRRDQQQARAWAAEERQRARCERRRQQLARTRPGRSATRREQQDAYDHECIAGGY